jgi:hypothetical protein
MDPALPSNGALTEAATPRNSEMVAEALFSYR